MLHNIPLLHRSVQIAPLVRSNRAPHTLPPLDIRPPARQHPIPTLRQVQEFLEIGQGVVAIVEAAGVAGEVIVVLETHAVAVDELAVDVGFGGELVEVVVLADVFEQVAGDLGDGVEIGGGLWAVGLLGRATECFVGFPIELLAFAAAVPLVLAFGAAFEGFVCWIFMAFGAGSLGEVHG